MVLCGMCFGCDEEMVFIEFGGMEIYFVVGYDVEEVIDIGFDCDEY